jgi:hypothetical protein
MLEKLATQELLPMVTDKKSPNKILISSKRISRKRHYQRKLLDNKHSTPFKCHKTLVPLLPVSSAGNCVFFWLWKLPMSWSHKFKYTVICIVPFVS